jgi:hypothetical protein
LARDATAYAPLDEQVVDHASSLLEALPLSCVTTRTLPIAAFGGSSSSSASRIGGTVPNPRDARRVNYAKEKWNAVSFAADRQAVQFHKELTSEVMALRRAWKNVNTKVVFPDTVPDEALTYFKPPEKFGQGWEMFDAKKHIDILALDRIATQRQNSLREAEARKERREEAEQKLLRSVSRSPSRRSAGGSSSPMRRSVSHIPRGGSNLSPSRAGSSSPHRGDISTAADERNTIEEVDVRRLVSDEQVANLFYEDGVAKEIESLKWDFKEFHPPQEWKERHSRRMAALTRQAAEWRPLEWKREVVVEKPQASRVTSIPAVAPFFSSGVRVLDPKLPIPAAMQGSGVSRAQMEGGLLKDAFVIRPDAQKAQKFATTHLSDGSTNRIRAAMAPVVVEGMTWGDIMVKTEELSGASSL